jgi:hypothetical protein
MLRFWLVTSIENKNMILIYFYVIMFFIYHLLNSLVCYLTYFRSAKLKERFAKLDDT